MQVLVTIPDELAAQAQARGLTLEHRLADLLVADLAGSAIPLSQSDESPLSRRDAVEAMLSFAKKYNVRTDGQDIKSMVHEGHKY